MRKTHILILGAGPAGLTVANYLRSHGIQDFIVLEKESCAGGLCRSVMVDGSPLDIGGGHFLDVRRPKVNEFLFQFMPENEWNIFDRDSRIFIHENYIGHPFEANIWQLPKELQNIYLESIEKAGCNTGESIPTKFVDWIHWKLGDEIANHYMIPYNQKMFSKNLNSLGTYWLEKLPNVSYEEVLKSCKEKKAYGTQPGHARFYYPKKYGYGELWNRMATAIHSNIIYEQKVIELNAENNTVYTINGEIYQADYIVTTIPWNSIESLSNAENAVLEAIKQLKHNSIEIRYYKNNLDSNAHWIYYPDETLAFHRILLRHNFCTNSKGYWTECNLERTNLIPENERENFHYINEYAYPLNTINKENEMTIITNWAKRHRIIPLGRWGEHQHFNSDVTVERGLNLGKWLVEQ